MAFHNDDKLGSRIMKGRIPYHWHAHFNVGLWENDKGRMPLQGLVTQM